MKNKNHKFFNYVIIAAVLIIPFMYSFFYLKAYWNPYGEGNIDNLPVAIVNEDKGSKGEELVKEIKDSNRLLITPHIAWASVEARTKLMDIILGQIKEFFNID